MGEATQGNMSLGDIIFRNAAGGIAVTDPAGAVVEVNAAFSSLTGYSADEIRGKGLNVLSSGQHPPEFYAEMWRSLLDTGRWQGEIWNRRKNGELYAEWLSISEVRDDGGKLTHYIGVFTDITRIVESQTQLRFLAQHDPATQLPNRLLFSDRFEHAVRRALRDLRQMAVLYIDLNQNNPASAVHGVGATITAEVAKRMQTCIRETDTLARLGTHEFVVLIENIDGPRGASQTADKLLKTFNSPIKIGEDKLFVAANIGISLFPMDGHELNPLIANADTAMHEARLQGRNTYRFYASEMSAYAGERMMLEGLLRQAMEHNELSLHYQPQFDANTGELTGVEALLRWTNLALGMVGPDRFVPVAEDNGLIHPIGEWVLREACSQFVDWQRQGTAPQTLSVNVSAKQIEVADFVEMVESVLQDTGMDGRYLELELTEAVLTEVSYVVPTIESLRSLGVQISIDDFGTGSSSLNNLKSLPIRKLKIDRSFVRDIGHDPGNESIVRAIIGLARTFGLHAIAEGVETEDQADFLRREGCEFFQGYLLGRAVTATDFPAFFGSRIKAAS